MLTTHHRLPADILVEIQGEGGRALDEVRRMYGHYTVNKPEAEPDIHCRFISETPNPSSVLGQPQSYYGRDGDRFVVRTGTNFLTIDPEWSDIRVSPGWEPYRVVYIIELAVRQRLVEAGEALIHGACARFEGKTLLFPSWRGAGKTNTMLSLLTAGGDYLSDDRVWVDDSGNVRGHPTPTAPHIQQLESFPQLHQSDETPRERLINLIKANTDPTRSFPERALRYATDRYLDTLDRDFQNISDVVPGAEWIPEGEVDAVVLLQAAPRNQHVEVEKLSAKDLASALRAIHDYEWNAMLREYATTFDSLFSGHNRTGALTEVTEAEEKVLDGLSTSLPTYVANIPRTNDWRESGVSDEVVERLGRLELPEAQQPEASPST